MLSVLPVFIPLKFIVGISKRKADTKHHLPL